MAHRNIYAIFAVIVCLLFVLFVWPTLYRYDKLTLGGNSLPVRTNRITGTGEIFHPGGYWQKRSAPEQPQQPTMNKPSYNSTPDDIITKAWEK
jgi:hypothetical protein